jgi:hypothetical protein
MPFTERLPDCTSSPGTFFSLSCFTKKSVPSLKSLRGAPDQYAVLHVAVLQLPPAVIHSPVRSTSQAQMAFFGLAGLSLSSRRDQ